MLCVRRERREGGERKRGEKEGREGGERRRGGRVGEGEKWERVREGERGRKRMCV